MIDDGPLTPNDLHSQERISAASGALPNGSFAEMIKSPFEDQALSKVWRDRFAAFDKYGAPAVMYKSGGLDGRSFLAKMNIWLSVYGLIFNVFYLLTLGLWKRSIVIAFAVFCFLFTYQILHHKSDFNPIFMFWLLTAILSASTANYGYYVKRRTGVDRWNAFDYT